MAKRPVVALVGGESLLGREIRDLAGGTGGGFELRLLAGDEVPSGTLSADRLSASGKATVMATVAASEMT